MPSWRSSMLRLAPNEKLKRLLADSAAVGAVSEASSLRCAGPAERRASGRVVLLREPTLDFWLQRRALANQASGGLPNIRRLSRGRRTGVTTRSPPDRRSPHGTGPAPSQHGRPDTGRRAGPAGGRPCRNRAPGSDGHSCAMPSGGSTASTSAIGIAAILVHALTNEPSGST